MAGVAVNSPMHNAARAFSLLRTIRSLSFECFVHAGERIGVGHASYAETEFAEKNQGGQQGGQTQRSPKGGRRGGSQANARQSGPDDQPGIAGRRRAWR